MVAAAVDNDTHFTAARPHAVATTAPTADGSDLIALSPFFFYPPSFFAHIQRTASASTYNMIQQFRSISNFIQVDIVPLRLYLRPIYSFTNFTSLDRRYTNLWSNKANHFIFLVTFSPEFLNFCLNERTVTRNN